MAIGFFDDFSCFGDLEVLAQDISRVDLLSKAMGLNLNLCKCEIITEAQQNALPPILQSLIYLNTEEASLLGAPITTGQAMNTILQAKCADLACARERLPLIAAHDALLILRNSVGCFQIVVYLEVFTMYRPSCPGGIRRAPTFCSIYAGKLSAHGYRMDPGESSSGERGSWH